MEKPMKRVMYNPDGSLLIKSWDDSLTVKRKQESAFGPKQPVKGLNPFPDDDTPADIGLPGELESYEDRYLNDVVYNWETELDY